MTALDPAATTVVTEAVLRDHLERLLGALGVPGSQAALVADNLIEADLRGVDSHGSTSWRSMTAGCAAATSTR